MSVADPNRVLLTGENPFIRLSVDDSDDYTTNASFWRIIFSPAGAGHVLFVKSELTQNDWRIYTDNGDMTRWLQSGIQGILNAELSDQGIAMIDAAFTRSGDAQKDWTETIRSTDEEVVLSWFDLGDPMLIHTYPGDKPGDRPVGVCTVFVPALVARLSINGEDAPGQAWPREREGRSFSTCSLAFSESWTEPR
jgi:hypothetical protein